VSVTVLSRRLILHPLSLALASALTTAMLWWVDAGVAIA